MSDKINNIDKRPWGYYEILSDEGNYKVKKMTVYPGKRLSLQSHKLRSEHWFIVLGNGNLTINNNISEIFAGQSIDISRETLHRIENTGTTDLTFIEIQTGEYFGEDDIIRYEDDYGRISHKAE